MAAVIYMISVYPVRSKEKTSKTSVDFVEMLFYWGPSPYAWKLASSSAKGCPHTLQKEGGIFFWQQKY